MLYSMAPASLLVINLIINWESLRKYGFRINKDDEKNSVPVRYNYFILAATIYIFVDAAWGIMYEHHDNPALFPFIYSFTVFYFLFMLLTMLTWTRYIFAYLDKRGRKSNLLLHGVWIMVMIGVICLMANRFGHFMFSYNEAHEYIGESGRNISFLLQIAFYAVISIYMLYVVHKSVGRERVRYQAVAFTSIVLGVFLVLQILYSFLPSYAIGLMIGISLVHSFVQSGENRQKEVHDHIASAMAEDYEAIFYIEIENGEYLSFSLSQKYRSITATATGKNFFKDAVESIDQCVYPDDRDYAKGFYDKETLLKNIGGKRSFSFKYRVMVEGEPRFFLFTVMPERGGKYLIFYEKDIQDELNAELAQKENQKKTVTFSQIAESLASNYDMIYYVDVTDSTYVGYEVNNIFGHLQIGRSGKDFFLDCLEKIPSVIYMPDIDAVTDYLNKDNMISSLEIRKEHNIDYRITIDGSPRYTRMTAKKASDGKHIIIGVEDIDAEVQREKQQLSALKSEKELARRDELTGIKNKTAYKELEASVQGNIDNCIDYLEFGLVVCDANNLKYINDTFGHAAGDEYIKSAARILCDIFVHSPVFRVGGDEFVVFLRGGDFAIRHELMEKLRNQVLENNKAGNGVVLAAGMSDYNPETDKYVVEIFERADKEMYEDKQRLKALKSKQ